MIGLKTHYSYRFLFAPGTIGAIAWLARNEDRAHRIKHGLIVSMVGDGGGPTYKKVDEATLRSTEPSRTCFTFRAQTDDRRFLPNGYDERQYCSPGFNLPVGLFQRSEFGKIPQYHTSADNLLIGQVTSLNHIT